MNKRESEGLADLLEMSLTGSLPDLRSIVQTVIKHLRKEYGDISDSIDTPLQTSDIEDPLHQFDMT